MGNHIGPPQPKRIEDSPYPTNTSRAVNSEHFEQFYNSPTCSSSDFKANDPKVLNSLVESYRDCFANYMKKLDKKLKKLPLNIDTDISVDDQRLRDYNLKLPERFYKANIKARFKLTEKGIYKIFNELIKNGRIHSDNYLSLIMKSCIHRGILAPFVKMFSNEPLDLELYLWSFLADVREEKKDFTITETIDDTSTGIGKAALFCTTLFQPFAPLAVDANKTYTAVQLYLNEDFLCTDFKVAFIDKSESCSSSISHQ